MAATQCRDPSWASKSLWRLRVDLQTEDGLYHGVGVLPRPNPSQPTKLIIIHLERALWLRPHLNGSSFQRAAGCWPADDAGHREGSPSRARIAISVRLLLRACPCLPQARSAGPSSPPTEAVYLRADVAATICCDRVLERSATSPNYNRAECVYILTQKKPLDGPRSLQTTKTPADQIVSVSFGVPKQIVRTQVYQPGRAGCGLAQRLTACWRCKSELRTTGASGGTCRPVG